MGKGGGGTDVPGWRTALHRLGSEALESGLGPGGCGKWCELDLERSRASVGLLVTGEGSGG